MVRQKINQTVYAAPVCSFLCSSLVIAALMGDVVANADASISPSGAVPEINQASQKAAINWQGFSVDTNETVNFNQPNANSMTLTRVIGNEKSVIKGANNTPKATIINDRHTSGDVTLGTNVFSYYGADDDLVGYESRYSPCNFLIL